MRVLHSSDWHLGRSLGDKKRYDEFSAFLNWLIGVIAEQSIDVLLVAGDIFDTTAPSHRAQQLYYDFLHQVAKSCCRHVVLIGGNHDSASLLAAPQQLLKALRVHVVAAVTESVEDEVLVLEDDAGDPKLIVCAVPYLRDRDIRQVEDGESYSDKQTKLVAGIREHYAAVARVVEARRQEWGSDLPSIAMGHLFTAGGQTIEGDGVRELYVGSLAHVPPSTFGPVFDYVALGHLHVPQIVGGDASRRYSGSPIPMNFGEHKQEKSVVLVEFKGSEPVIELLPVPCFQRLARVQGDLKKIGEELALLCRESLPEQSIWVEVSYNGEEIVPDLRQKVFEMVQDSSVEVLSVKNLRGSFGQLGSSDELESLEDLTPNQVFERCLKANKIPDDQLEDLTQTFAVAFASLAESIGTTGGRG